MHPVRLTAEETVEVYFCGCKQTSTPPYCDGTHMSEAVQNCELGECLSLLVKLDWAGSCFDHAMKKCNNKTESWLTVSWNSIP